MTRMIRLLLGAPLICIVSCANGEASMDSLCDSRVQATISANVQGKELLEMLKDGESVCRKFDPFKIQAAKAYAEIGDVPAAKHWLEGAQASTHEEQEMVWRIRYLIEVQNESPEGAERVAREVIKEAPEYFFGYAALARVQTAGGQDKLAIANVELAKKLVRPKEKSLAAQIVGPAAGAYFNEGRYSEALNLLQEQFQYSPGSLLDPVLAQIAVLSASEIGQKDLAEQLLAEHDRLRGSAPEAPNIKEARAFIRR